MKTISSQSQLQKIMEQKLINVLNDSADEILEEFKEYVQKYVYDNHGQNSVYKNPNGQEFKENWEWTAIKKKAFELSKTMFFDWENLSNEPDYFSDSPYNGKVYGIHGSMVRERDRDVRKYLPEILNRRLSSRSPVSVFRPQQYWKVFISVMFNAGKISKIIEKHAKKHGLEKVR